MIFNRVLRGSVLRSYGVLPVLGLLAACHSPLPPRPSGNAATAPTRPAPSKPATPAILPSLERPTSPAYEGDLSIFEHPERDRRLQIHRVMQLLGIEEGTDVADVGAGGGWFSVRAARRVGTGRVYAVEINPSYVEHIEERARREKLTNVQTVLAGESDPGLPERSVDVVLLLKTYHEMSDPFPVLSALRRAMRPGARLGIIDRNGHGDDHGLDEDVVRREVTSVGFAFRERHDWSSPEERVEYFLIFVR